MSEIQASVTMYQQQFGEHFQKNYCYVLFECGNIGKVSEKKAALAKIKETFLPKDCVGSINDYMKRIKGLIIIDMKSYMRERQRWIDTIGQIEINQIQDEQINIKTASNWQGQQGKLEFVLLDI